ncbi:hypothetical protein PNP85_14750 [Halobacterium salinarum]|uniref:HEAT repeat domain-containing protein n=1 Tax=Halobacterium salinarum (strain ATCC 33171 / DSM 3754 / JCM 8978 / NBRC 102687 / NCIMB 764 / 91-R6) TaxID=2597657 RepID=A0A4D6GS66_HALS9|nr:hypothetical protein [Halobacterium salinarum]MDL0125260.1 hypothetical protein [Halobacterium salinarum]MDL0131474.1 hypothetical protein [Halobacterium salinarum]MDL0140756.1 hypothetical protein [Halobacterium salinarum]QCC44594.1 hypothetical protein HBSAL_04395 [Halobacterium salinarum]TYO73934.1 hypothetical protein APQ99_02340 [Halobacterium salinarum DSM 3754]
MAEREADTADSGALPVDPRDLLAVATDESVDPYRREAAIKRLGEVSGPAERYLEALASGEALSPIEQSLATTVLNERLRARTNE